MKREEPSTAPVSAPAIADLTRHLHTCICQKCTEHDLIQRHSLFSQSALVVHEELGQEISVRCLAAIAESRRRKKNGLLFLVANKSQGTGTFVRNVAFKPPVPMRAGGSPAMVAVLRRVS